MQMSKVQTNDERAESNSNTAQVNSKLWEHGRWKPNKVVPRPGKLLAAMLKTASSASQDQWPCLQLCLSACSRSARRHAGSPRGHRGGDRGWAPPSRTRAQRETKRRTTQRHGRAAFAGQEDTRAAHPIAIARAQCAKGCSQLTSEYQRGVLVATYLVGCNVLDGERTKRNHSSAACEPCCLSMVSRYGSDPLE